MTEAIQTEVLVLGGGPGGYTAAFRAADLGKKVVLVERYPVIGGVCLNVGCIPSKALLHMAQLIHELEEFKHFGLNYGTPDLDLDKIRSWKSSVTKTLTDGLAKLVKQRKVTLIQGVGQFTGANSLTVHTADGVQTVNFEQAIIAAGSQPTKIPNFPNDDPRLLDSTDALELKSIPKKMLIVGGGIIGLEMATVYHALGAEISVVELMEQIIPGCDKDLITPLFRRIKKQYKNIWLETRVTSIEALTDGLKVSFEGKDAPESEVFDQFWLRSAGNRTARKLVRKQQALTLMSVALLPWTNNSAPTSRIFSPLAILSAIRCWHIKPRMKARLLPK